MMNDELPSNLETYLSWLEATRGLRFDGYDDLWAWSTLDLEGFWTSIWEHFDVVSSHPPEIVLSDTSMPGTKWFEGAKLNYVENIFQDKNPDDVAILHSSETRTMAEVSWAELELAVARAADELLGLGVQVGDRVVACLPNIIETVVAFLATASVGGIWSCCSPDLGAQTVVDRFHQIQPKVLFCVDGYNYGGKSYDKSTLADDLRRALPSLETIVLVPYLPSVKSPQQRTSVITWDDFVGSKPAQLKCQQLEFDHPLWILFSSGTTGKPKAIVQGHGGILLEHLKSHHLHLDLHQGDRFFWFTTTGWMMWNYLVSGLLTNAAIVLFDGSPGFPDQNRLWQVVADTEATFFGTSASFLSANQKAAIKPRSNRNLSALRAMGSTGSPLAPESFDWVQSELGDGVWLSSSSGGTDVCSAFLGGVPGEPVVRGELQARALGCKVESYDAAGKPVIGQMGELVVTQPMPSMPLRFWNDDEAMSLYREAYFEMFPGVWRHGDWIEISSKGTSIIHGRSDSTINRSGIRIGTSEIYRCLQTTVEVIDALVVDLPLPGTDGWIMLFVVLREGETMTDELHGRILAQISSNSSPRHIPNEIQVIAAVPRTLTGKILEVPVKRILMGTPVAEAVSRDSMANPNSLDYFVHQSASLARHP